MRPLEGALPRLAVSYLFFAALFQLAALALLLQRRARRELAGRRSAG